MILLRLVRHAFSTGHLTYRHEDCRDMFLNRYL